MLSAESFEGINQVYLKCPKYSNRLSELSKALCESEGHEFRHSEINHIVETSPEVYQNNGGRGNVD